MDVYFLVKGFVEEQIRYLNSPLTLDAETLDSLVASDSEDDDIGDDADDHEEQGNSPRFTSQLLSTVLGRVDHRKKIYYNKIFTQQAIKHVSLQVQSAFFAKSKNAIKKLEDKRSELFVVADPKVVFQASSKLEFRRHNLSTLSRKELLEMANNIQNACGSNQRLQEAIKKYNQSLARHRQCKSVLSTIESTFTDNPQENVQPNLITKQSPMLEDLAKLRTLCAKISAKIQSNPSQLKRLLEEQGNQEKHLDKRINLALSHNTTALI